MNKQTVEKIRVLYASGLYGRADLMIKALLEYPNIKSEKAIDMILSYEVHPEVKSNLRGRIQEMPKLHNVLDRCRHELSIVDQVDIARVMEGKIDPEYNETRNSILKKYQGEFNKYPWKSVDFFRKYGNIDFSSDFLSENSG